MLRTVRAEKLSRS